MAISEVQLVEWEQEAPIAALDRNPTKRIEYCKTVVPSLCSAVREASKTISSLKAMVINAQEHARNSEHSYRQRQEIVDKQAGLIREQTQKISGLADLIDVGIQERVNLAKKVNEQETLIAALRKEVNSLTTVIEQGDAEIAAAKADRINAAEAIALAKEASNVCGKRRFEGVKKLLTVYHDCFENITEETQVVICGSEISAVNHICHVPGKPDRESLMRFTQPTHIANPATYCKQCDVLYLGINEIPVELHVDGI